MASGEFWSRKVPTKLMSSNPAAAITFRDTRFGWRHARWTDLAIVSWSRWQCHTMVTTQFKAYCDLEMPHWSQEVGCLLSLSEGQVCRELTAETEAPEGAASAPAASATWWAGDRTQGSCGCWRVPTISHTPAESKVSSSKRHACCSVAITITIRIKFLDIYIFLVWCRSRWSCGDTRKQSRR